MGLPVKLLNMLTFKKLYFFKASHCFMHMDVLPAFVQIHHVWVVPTEARSEHSIPGTGVN